MMTSIFSLLVKSIYLSFEAEGCPLSSHPTTLAPASSFGPKYFPFRGLPFELQHHNHSPPSQLLVPPVISV